jgi:hypothetical protein
MDSNSPHIPLISRLNYEKKFNERNGCIYRIFNNDLYIKIHDLLFWKDYSGVDLNKECRATSSAFFRCINNLSFSDLFSFNSIYLIDTYEVWNIDNLKYNRYSYLKKIVEFFESLGVVDKVVFLNNNFLSEYKSIKHKTICSFILNPHTLEDIGTVKERRKSPFKYRFCFYSRKPREHRDRLFKFLSYSNILENTLTSHGLIYTDREFIDNHSYDIAAMDSFSSSNCLINIVGETSFYKTNATGNICFITEKTDKCLYGMMPFVIVGNPFILKYLKTFGFKTFDSVWDESYDNILDDDMRMKAIEELLIEINSWSTDKIKEIEKSLYEITLYNRKKYDHLYKLRNTINVKLNDKYVNNFFIYEDLIKRL